MDELGTSIPAQESGLSASFANPTANVLGTEVTALDLNGTVRLLIKLVQSKRRSYVCVANVHTTTLALRDQRFRRALHGATAVVADGIPVLWRVRAAGYPHAGRVYGADLVESTCMAGSGAGLRHGFFGGLEGVADAMVIRLGERYPAFKVGGVWNPGAIQNGEVSPTRLLEAINKSDCDILWVGLGAPKQELWMAQHRRYLHAPVLVGVGQAFDILSGRTIRPPVWMSSHGLEWLYRLVHEPRRLWKRYLVYNSLFIWYLLLESFRCNSYRAKS
jgi:N-acetylglucosaminyldiphosphoundecaprenol N-acetyl-beta-D-mannosaminyltransferase